MASDHDLHKHKGSNQKLFTSHSISCVTPLAFVHFTTERRCIWLPYAPVTLHHDVKQNGTHIQLSGS
jgi:hypothetical protein